jgi:PAS domain S-box-containing protein
VSDSSLPHVTAISTDPAWLVDSRGRIIAWNSAAETLFGYSPAEVIGRDCRSLMGCQTCCVGASALGTAPEGQPTRTLRVRCRDGSYRTVRLKAVVLVHEDPVRQEATLHLAHPCQPKHEGLRIHVLGPIEVERYDGSRVDGTGWRRTKVRALLAILALERGRPVHRERLVDLLWSDLDYAAGRRNLTSTVYDLRRALAPAGQPANCGNDVVYESNQYFLKWSAANWLDVVEFERELHLAKAAKAAPQKAGHFRSALQLYRSDFLADIILVFQDDFYLREQWRLRELYLEALDALGVVEDSQGATGKAQDLFSRVLALDPCREPACRHLMSLHRRAGERTAALACYHQLVRALADEIGATPDRATVQMYEELLETA